MQKCEEWFWKPCVPMWITPFQSLSQLHESLYNEETNVVFMQEKEGTLLSDFKFKLKESPFMCFT